MKNMQIGRRMILVSALAALPIYQAIVLAEDKPAFKDEKEKASYAIGLYFGNQIKSGNMEVDTDVIMKAMNDALAGGEPKLNQQEAREAITTYQRASQAKAAAKNHAAGEAFLAANKTKDGVKVLPVAMGDGKSEELQYKVITEGTGALPGSNDTVKVEYRGTLIDGTEFDSSAKHGGKPAQFPINRVIKGWTEALLKMKVGSKWQLFIPSTLAYGDRGQQNIPPGSTLIFDVELVESQPPAAPAAPAGAASSKPLTSDIIRVPSAEEMKAGAKIEVIKASDLEKTNAATHSPK